MDIRVPWRPSPWRGAPALSDAWIASPILYDMWGAIKGVGVFLLFHINEKGALNGRDRAKSMLSFRARRAGL